MYLIQKLYQFDTRFIFMARKAMPVTSMNRQFKCKGNTILSIWQ